jgi:hypothetical protein
MQRGALPDLNTFLLVAEHLSFRAAAERLELTAPAVSHSIRQLEARLLNRTTRQVLEAAARVRSTGPSYHRIEKPQGVANRVANHVTRRTPHGGAPLWQCLQS